MPRVCTNGAILAAARWAAPAALALDLLAGAALARELFPPLDPPDLAAPTPAAAAPFFLQADVQTRARAVQCLTEAVYYEAGAEPRHGQEAVAQVVINRLRRPGFPKSVCGVVFEGWERPTGCQFSFACDGSLALRPAAARWDAAQQVASAALDGYVAGEIGPATHYHTIDVTPYWSGSLIPMGRIGRHVFYAMPGRQGAPDASMAPYAGVEPALFASETPLRARGTRRGPALAHASHPPAVVEADFSVWGLKIATITADHGRVVVRHVPDPVEPAGSPDP